MSNFGIVSHVLVGAEHSELSHWPKYISGLVGPRKKKDLTRIGVPAGEAGRQT